MRVWGLLQLNGRTEHASHSPSEDRGQGCQKETQGIGLPLSNTHCICGCNSFTCTCIHLLIPFSINMITCLCRKYLSNWFTFQLRSSYITAHSETLITKPSRNSFHCQTHLGGQLFSVRYGWFWVDCKFALQQSTLTFSQRGWKLNQLAC